MGIQKLDMMKDTRNVIDKDGIVHTAVNFTAIEKINELVDAVNELQEFADVADKQLATLMEENNIHEKQIDELQMKVEPEKCENPSENMLTKSLRIDKEFAEDECARLQDELERTKKQLETAVSALKYIQDGNLGFSPAMDFAEKALEQINELKEQQ